MTAPEPFVQTEVQRVWEVLREDGSVWAFNEEPTPEAAMAKAKSTLARHLSWQRDFEARHGSPSEVADFTGVRLVAVRQRTSVTVNVYTTKYGTEIKFPEDGAS